MRPRRRTTRRRRSRRSTPITAVTARSTSATTRARPPGSAGLDRGRLRPRLPGLPRGAGGRHPAPRRQPLRGRHGGDADPDRDARRLDDHRPDPDGDAGRRRAPGPRHLDRRRRCAPTRRRHAAARRQRRAARGGNTAGGRRRAGADGGPHGRSARRRDDARREPDARDRHPLGRRRPADPGDHDRHRAARRGGARLLGDQRQLPGRAARVERGGFRARGTWADFSDWLKFGR